MNAETVLLIAGSSEASDTCQRALERDGLTVLRAADGLSGMRDALALQPDLVVLDFAADEAADVMRARRALRAAGIPLIVLASGHVAEEELGRPSGVTFLLSPPDPATLVTSARKAMEAARAERQRASDNAGHT